MFTKSRTLALGVAIAGAIGLGAPMASAATLASQPGNSGAVNTVTGQVQSLGCGNVLPGNAVTGNATGTKAAKGEAVAGSLPGDSTASSSTASSGVSCGMVTKEIQTLVCGATPVSAAGSQVPLGPLAGAFAAFTQSAVSSAASSSAASACSLSGK
jgi:hypothetical protein